MEPSPHAPLRRRVSRRKPVWLAVLTFLCLTVTAVVSPAAETKPSGDLTELSISELMEVEVATVYGASKYEQSVTEAPSSVTIVTANEISKFGYRTIADILRSVRGFYVTYDRYYHYLGSRGFSRPGDYNTRYLLLIDGHRVNDNIYNTAFIGTEFPLDVDLIERVEVIRGASSSLYGSNAFLGVINVITRRGRDMGGLEVSGEVASQDTYRGRLSYGDVKSNGWEFIFSGTAYRSEGDDKLYYREFDAPKTNNGIARNCDDDEYEDLFSTVSYGGVTLQGAYVSRQKNIPTAPWGLDFNDSRTDSVERRAYLDLTYDRSIGGRLHLTGRFSYDYYYYEGTWPFEGILNYDEAHGRWWGGEIEANGTVTDRHRLTGGLEFTRNDRQDQYNYDKKPYESYLDDERSSTNWGMYLQDEWKIVPEMTLYAGVRYDHYDTFGGTANPRVALIWRPAERTAVKFLFGTAFRAPTPYELYYNDDDVSEKSNPDLDPETITSGEVIVERYFAGDLRTTCSVFYHDIKDVIAQEEDPSDNLLVFKNRGEVEAYGVEVEVEKRWQSGFSALASYSFQESEYRPSGDDLENSPRHLAKLNLLVPIIKGRLTAGFEEQYISRRTLVNSGHTGEAWITNLTLFGQDSASGIEVSLSAYNLFNSSYEDPASWEHTQSAIEQDGRLVRLKLTWRY